MNARTFVLVCCAFVLMQACRPVSAQTPAPDAPGLLQRLRERAREVKDAVYDYGGLALGLADAYYEEHIQPMTASYTEWASNLRSSMWTKIKTTMDKYTSRENPQ